MRMLCCPRRAPLSASNRLPGGTAISRRSRTRFSCVNFRARIAHSVLGQRCRARRLSMPLNKSSVAVSAKERITLRIITRSVTPCQRAHSDPGWTGRRWPDTAEHRRAPPQSNPTCTGTEGSAAGSLAPIGQWRRRQGCARSRSFNTNGRPDRPPPHAANCHRNLFHLARRRACYNRPAGGTDGGERNTPPAGGTGRRTHCAA